jgi:hypothetical protein
MLPLGSAATLVIGHLIVAREAGQRPMESVDTARATY